MAGAMLFRVGLTAAMGLCFLAGGCRGGVSAVSEIGDSPELVRRSGRPVSRDAPLLRDAVEATAAAYPDEGK